MALAAVVCDETKHKAGHSMGCEMGDSTNVKQIGIYKDMCRTATAMVSVGGRNLKIIENPLN